MDLSFPEKLRRNRFWQEVTQLETIVLAVAALIILGVLAFIELSEEVLEGTTRRLDQQLFLLLRNPQNVTDPFGPLWLQELGRDMTALGGVGVLTLVTCAVLVYLLIHRRFHTSTFLLIAVLGGALVSMFLKETLARPRPTLVPHGSYVVTASFPSGHSMLSAVTYLTLGAILAQIQVERWMKIYTLAWALLLTVLVGISRVYLGVHWPTDVLGGWIAGIAWALLCWLVARAIRLRYRDPPS